MKYLNRQGIEQKYPRLVTILQHQFLLCKDEAACCILDYLSGLSITCEAISWSGRTPQEAIIIAVRNRQNLV